jgi:hypothetical protein
MPSMEYWNQIVKFASVLICLLKLKEILTFFRVSVNKMKLPLGISDDLKTRIYLPLAFYRE